jgi:RNA polymerase sigma factor (sigma-70 family)
MAYDEAHSALDPIVQCIFRRKARQIVGRAGADDVNDVEHELLAESLRRLPGFDPHRANLHAFANVIADHAAYDYRRRARQREERRALSLSAPVVGQDGDAEELSALIRRPDLDARLGLATRDPQDAACLADDVATVLGKLPPHLRHLAERRAAGDTVTQVARDLGLPRTTVSDWVGKLRAAFENAGLRDYLPEPCPARPSRRALCG